MINSRAAQIVAHILACMAFMIMPFLLSPDWPDVWMVMRNPHGLADVGFQALLLAFFYVNYYYFLPRFYFFKRYLLYFSIVAGCMVVLLGSISLVTHGMLEPRPIHPGPGGADFQGPPVRGFGGPPRHSNPFAFLLFDHHLYLFFIVFFVSLLAKISQKWKKTEKEKLNAELSYLKAQINPHFLFNTLNSIYSLAIDKSDYTPTAIVKLSGMMRYVITEASEELVPLEKEINYISDYIELQKLRLGDTVQLDYKVEGASSGKKIAPLLLIPAIENAFKHGVNPEENSEISVRITVREYSLELNVHNRKVSRADNEEASGLGLTNTRNRLNLMYASRHNIEIRENDTEFIVSLIISFR